ncbi:MAG: DUF975 family protein [Clostridia bacterium]|nr:DUF975 family protein [Clostridia bacterium]
MTISQLKQNAKAMLKGNWGLAIGIVLLNAVLVGVVGNIVPGIGALILTGPLTFGLTLAFLTLARTGKMYFEHLFKGFENFGTTCIAGILQNVFIALWTLLLVIPGIVKSYSYALTYYLINDNPNLSANDAITESRKMMDGHKLDLFVLDLSFIGWYFLSAFTFGILLIYVVPYHHAAKASFYEDLKNTANA